MTEPEFDEAVQIHGPNYYRVLSRDNQEVKQRYFIDAGRTFSPQKAAIELARKEIFRKHPVSKELYIFNSKKNIFEPAEPEIGKWISLNLCEYARTGYVTETINEILRTCETGTIPHPRYIQLKNGVFDLFAGQLMQFNPTLFFTRQLPFVYDPLASCNKIFDFLNSAQPIKENQKTLLEFAAYCLYLDRPIQRSNILLYGHGANGKSTWLTTLRNFLGFENTCSVSIQSMEKNRFSTYTMMDKLANIQADLSNEELNSSSVFKQITGGDAIEVEKKLGAQFPAVLPLKFIFSANNPPQVPDYEPAFFRRWILMPFNENFEGREIQGLEQSLITPEELSGLFNLVYPLLPKLLEAGRFTHAPTTEQTRELYLTLSRPLYAFIKECLIYPDDGSECTPKVDFYRVYQEWAKKNNKPSYGSQDFQKRFQTEPEIAGLPIDARMPATSVRAREHAWRGIAIKPNFKPSQKITTVEEVKSSIEQEKK